MRRHRKTLTYLLAYWHSTCDSKVHTVAYLLRRCVHVVQLVRQVLRVQAGRALYRAVPGHLVTRLVPAGLYIQEGPTVQVIQYTQ